MKRKSLTVKNKIHKKILSYLKNKEFKKIYKNFEEFLKYRKISSFVVALSGGSDSLALAYFSKCFQILNNKKVYYVHIDHKIRKNSSKEASSFKSKTIPSPDELLEVRISSIVFKPSAEVAVPTK